MEIKGAVAAVSVTAPFLDCRLCLSMLEKREGGRENIFWFLSDKGIYLVTGLPSHDFINYPPSSISLLVRAPPHDLGEGTDRNASPRIEGIS